MQYELLPDLGWAVRIGSTAALGWAARSGATAARGRATAARGGATAARGGAAAATTQLIILVFKYLIDVLSS